ncbi:hypothetical protein vseg_011819 [Gypsophila vaccaria]
MTEEVAKLRCQRIGCDAVFTADDNPDGSCRYHSSVPRFHDGMKEWSCCKKRSHDFSLFLEIPGCTTGKHTTEKPVITKAAPTPRNFTPTPAPATGNGTVASSRESCSRCRQGFFCSDHGSNPSPKLVEKKIATPASEGPVVTNTPARKIVGITEPQTCKNKGCGETFKEIDNHENACNYHPGPAVFHDRMRGWKCCDVHVKEFDEFMSIPPCTKGWHNGDPIS